jgi:hypothetical protein
MVAIRKEVTTQEDEDRKNKETDKPKRREMSLDSWAKKEG